MDRREYLFELTRKATAKFKDINKAKAWAKKEWRREVSLDQLITWVEDLMDREVIDGIESSRHDVNRAIRKKQGKYGGPAKVRNEFVSTTSRKVYRTAYFDQLIDGKSLGTLICSELERVGNTQMRVANGHVFNGRLCLELFAKIPKGKEKVMVETAFDSETVDSIAEKVKADLFEFVV